MAAAGRNVSTVSQGGRGTGVHGATSSMDGCIEACSECHRICLATGEQVLRRAGSQAASLVGALLDCAQMCATSADFMSRSSPLHGATCALCAEACRVCADACREAGSDDLRRCIEVCERCEASCAHMAAQMSRAH